MENDRYQKIKYLTEWTQLDYQEMIRLIRSKNPDLEDLPTEKCSICQFEFEPDEQDLCLLYTSDAADE